MARGILVFGASGSGQTTLSRVVAALLRFCHFDLDDYIWHRDTEKPFTVMHTRNEKIRGLTEAIAPHPHFVMSGSMDSFNAPFVPRFDLAVWLTAPTNTRVERVHARELAEFGARILAGGDMYEEHQSFLDAARRYDTNGSPCRRTHEEWAATLPCPVLSLDGTTAIAENAARVASQYIANTKEC